MVQYLINSTKTMNIKEIAIRADRAIRSKDKEAIKASIAEIQTLDTSESLSIRAQADYFLGNCFVTLHGFNEEEWYSSNLSLSVISYRKSLATFSEMGKLTAEEKFVKSSVLTNLGNTLSNQGRIFCSLEMWMKALSESENITTRLALAHDLLNIANCLFNQIHREIFYFEAYKQISTFIDNQKSVEEQHIHLLDDDSTFKRFYTSFEEAFKLENFDYLESYEIKTKTKIERAYIHWCGENKLFLNDLNILIDSKFGWSDIQTLPDMSFGWNSSLRLHEKLAYHGNFEELKDDYCYARYLTFTSLDIDYEKRSLFNSTFEHIDDMSHSYRNLKSQQLKTAFRIQYSLFDKIAYFLHRFFDLNEISKDHRISFDSMFRDLSIRDRWVPNSKIESTKNPYFHSLFHILKDIRDVKDAESVSIWLDPDANSFADIRNAIEHRSLKISDDFGYELAMQPPYASEDTSYSDEQVYEQRKLSSHSLLITETEFMNRLLALTKLARNSLLYLAHAIHYEESIKNNDGKLRMEVEVPVR